MTEPLLRRATSNDVANIDRLFVDAFDRYVERIGKPPAPMTADHAALLETARVWVIEDEQSIVGVLVTRPHFDHLEIDSIAVDPAAQGGGHGGRLLRRADDDARERGLAEIRLCTNETMTENLEFYPRRGFVETGRGVQDGFRRVFFAKRLAN